MSSDDTLDGAVTFEGCRLCAKRRAVIDGRYLLHYSEHEGHGLFCPMSYLLSDTGWRDLLNRCLDDAELQITYRRQPMISDLQMGPAKLAFWRIFLEHWSKLIGETLPTPIKLDIAQWIGEPAAQALDQRGSDLQ